MKKRILSLVLALVMLASMTTVAFAWIIDNVSADQATYYASGALKSLRVNFTWDTGGVPGYHGNAGDGVCMVLMTKELANSPGYGDYTSAGAMRNLYHNLAEAEADASLGIIRSTELSEVVMFQEYHWTFEFEENDIKLNENKTYYINIWTKLNGYFYPDALGAVIRVKDGKVQFADNDGSQIEDEDFEDVPTTDPNAPQQPQQPEQTTPDTPTVTPDTPTVTPPASRPNYDTSEEIVWQSGAKEESKGNPATGDGFNTAVSAVMALSVLAGAAVVLGKKK